VLNIKSNHKNETRTESIINKYSDLGEATFNLNSSVGLRMLDIKNTDIGICYGCDLGNMLLYASKFSKKIIGVEQNPDKFEYVLNRIKADNLQNINIVNSGNDSSILKHKYDYIILNDTSNELNINYSDNIFLDFIGKVCSNLNDGGKIYFAVNNSMYYENFISCLLSFSKKRKLFSKTKYIKLLRMSKFFDIKVYAVFPSNNFPIKILPLCKSISVNYSPVYLHSSRRNIVEKVIGRLQKYLDLIVFKRLKLYYFSPSFIFIAKYHS
jgi:hypothetical protein